MVTHEEDIAAHAHRVVRLRDGLIESDRAQEARRVEAAGAGGTIGRIGATGD